MDSSNLRPSCSDVRDLCFGTLDKSKLASCYDAGVAYADKFLPVRPQPQEERPPSPFSPEEFTSDEDEQDKEDEDDLTTPTDDDCKLYLFKDEIMSYRCNIDLKSPSFRDMVNEWVTSWTPRDSDGQRKTWIIVHAYYSKEKRHGGYGVILCDALGKPIRAAAKFSRTGHSFYYQVFKGINAGVELAELFKLSDFHIRCNSIRAPGFFRSICTCSNSKCNTTSLCKNCINLFHAERCKMSTVGPLVMGLIQKKVTDFYGSWGLGLAAHYVAKMEKKKILETEYEESSATAYDGSLFVPGEFPPGLENVIYADSFAISSL